jgi:hypothetical protein
MYIMGRPCSCMYLFMILTLLSSTCMSVQHLEGLTKGGGGFAKWHSCTGDSSGLNSERAPERGVFRCVEARQIVMWESEALINLAWSAATSVSLDRTRTYHIHFTSWAASAYFADLCKSWTDSGRLRERGRPR